MPKKTETVTWYKACEWKIDIEEISVLEVTDARLKIPGVIHKKPTWVKRTSAVKAYFPTLEDAVAWKRKRILVTTKVAQHIAAQAREASKEFEELYG